MPKKLPKIFVQIASYRDPECQWTVKDLFEKAAHPERIFVGICWQFDKTEDAHCFQIPYPRPNQVRVVEYDYHDAKGANWARVEASKLWDGEEFVFFSEPHIRYVQNWDLELLRMLDECPAEKPILSWVHSSYTPPYHLERVLVGSLSLMCFHPNGALLVNTHYLPDSIIPKKPFPSPALLVNGLFAKSNLIHEVPQDPYIYFEGDESQYSARAWTHGWDIFCANHPISYHLTDRSTRPSHWDDKPKKSEVLSKNSTERYRFLFGMQQTASAAAKKEIKKYGLGKARSLQAYEKFAGVNFKERKVFNQDKWVFKQTAESVIRPAPLLIQNWQVKELRDWLADCIAKNIDLAEIVKICSDRGISSTVSTAEYLLVKQENSPKKKFEISEGWKKWILENLLLGQEPEALLSVMVQEGIDAEAAKAAIADVQASPFLAVTKQSQEKLKKREWLLNTLDSLKRNNEAYTKPQKVPLPPFEEFLRDYYYENRIGIFTGAIDHWGAKNWTMPGLVDIVGKDAIVEVQQGRNSDDKYEINSYNLKSQMKFGEFIGKITAGEAGNNLYMTANNHAFKNPDLAKLLNDIGDIGDGYFDVNRFVDSSFLWLGDKGVITPFHHDLTNNFFIQIKGKKLYHMIPAMQVPYMYDSFHVYSDVNLLQLDLQKFPEFAKATVIEIELDEGDCLFIPIGCLHHVIGLTQNISMTLVNFNVPNSYPNFPAGGGTY